MDQKELGPMLQSSPFLEMSPGSSCCATGLKAQASLPDMKQPFVTGSIETPVGPVTQISSSPAWADRWGGVKARWGVGRMDYTVDPGLYSLGNPDNQSPVLVTANYKMSFDQLRQALPGRNAWILVLHTGGINVWCAAGKGTFGTRELVYEIESSGLSNIVSHGKIILPQLAGPGVAAHQVKELSGFRVIYGPIRAKDLPAFLDADLKAAPEMRLKTFTIRERSALIPIELVTGLKWSLLVLPIFFLLGGLGGSAGFWSNALNHGLFAVLVLLSGLIAGTVFTPLLLPWLPGRAFSIKGLIMGLIITMILVISFRAGDLTSLPARIESLSWLFMAPALAAFLAMNFTGSSTYTSFQGSGRK